MMIFKVNMDLVILPILLNSTKNVLTFKKVAIKIHNGCHKTIDSYVKQTT